MTASTRWRRMVRARLAEMESMQPGRGATGPAFWDAKRARRFSLHTQGTAERDPLFRRVRAQARRSSSVLDVGAGTGRFTVALAPRVARVTAVDSSPAMLAVLTRQARREGLSNIDVVARPWMEADVAPADISICSFVLPLVEDAAGFLTKLDSATRCHAFLTMNAGSLDGVVDHFWRHFHGAPRRPSPTYLDAVDVLAEVGVAAQVEVVEVRSRSEFPTLAKAVKAYLDLLLLPDTTAVRRELRGLLAAWLVSADGALRPPVRTWPIAIVSWEAQAVRD